MSEALSCTHLLLEYRSCTAGKSHPLGGETVDILASIAYDRVNV